MERTSWMTTYQTYHNVDYISFSTIHYIPIDDICGKRTTITPRIKNYDTALRDELGTIIHSHTTRPEMKTHITLSGDTLQTYREAGFTDMMTVQWLESLQKPKFGRVDIAVTAIATDGKAGFTPETAWRLYMDGKCKTRLTADKPVVDLEKNVETLYIGSRKSRNRLLRVYDKGLDLGGAANEIIRIELESREGANKIAQEISKGHNIAGMIRRYVDFEDSEYDKIMDCDPLPRYRIETDTEKDIKAKKVWMLQSVAPAMANLAHDLPDGWESEFWEEFTRTVAYHYNRNCE